MTLNTKRFFFIAMPSWTCNSSEWCQRLFTMNFKCFIFKNNLDCQEPAIRIVWFQMNQITTTALALWRWCLQMTELFSKSHTTLQNKNLSKIMLFHQPAFIKDSFIFINRWIKQHYILIHSNQKCKCYS